MQLHIGAERYTSSKLRNKAGPTGGFAGIGNSVDVGSLTEFLDTLDLSEYGLPKTVLFTLNPSDNALISVLSGSYSKDGVKGLITQGPAWWWCDSILFTPTHCYRICQEVKQPSACEKLNKINIIANCKTLDFAGF